MKTDCFRHNIIGLESAMEELPVGVPCKERRCALTVEMQEGV